MPVLPAALRDLLDVLRCPLCREPLDAATGGLRCPAGHAFDASRAGYVSLLGGGGAVSGDDDAMARARERFLGTGAYAPLLQALGDLAAEHVRAVGAAPAAAGAAPTLLDVGCGPGYYLAGALERFPSARGLGLDTSTRSLRFAARAHPRAAACGADVFAPLPLQDDAADLVLDVFAPRHGAEFARVLRPDGALLVARPAADHLLELREAVPGMVSVDPRKEERLHSALDPWFTTVEQREVRFALPLTPERARDLVAMTPSARHVDPTDLDQALPAGTTVTVAVLVSAHRPR
ncbi:putative RNA methyltransferase [Brachybacterium sp. YJGR34]|uniref:putative RNA methyltransferase n=1 Tax=Brachybacterium sp. YJGR34 TaxID=2059911 RepID=UPI000E0B59F6|nr:methyltransferase domain-containing protein [Brachybacterium sp. YJGR34]